MATIDIYNLAGDKVGTLELADANQGYTVPEALADVTPLAAHDALVAKSADVIVFSHPWVFPIVSRVPGLENKPFIYDSQNVEGHLRRSLLGEEGLAGGIAAMVESLERELCDLQVQRHANQFPDGAPNGDIQQRVLPETRPARIWFSSTGRDRPSIWTITTPGASVSAAPWRINCRTRWLK